MLDQGHGRLARVRSSSLENTGETPVPPNFFPADASSWLRISKSGRDGSRLHLPLDRRQAGERCCNFFVGIFVILQLTCEVIGVSGHIKMPVSAEIEKYGA